MLKPVTEIARAITGYWNARPVHAATNPGGMDVSDDGLTRGHIENFPAAVAAIGNMAQWTGEQADAASASADAAEAAANAIGSTVELVWDAGTADANPGAGKVRANALPALATWLYVSATDGVGVDIAALLATWDDSTSATKGDLRITGGGDAAKRLEYRITGTVVAAIGYAKVPVTFVGAGTAPAAADVVVLAYRPTGEKGATGTAATIAVGSVTTAAAGSLASVTNVGTPSAAVLDFVIPRGNTGATPVVSTTSTSNVTIGTGSKTFTTATALDLIAGAPVVVADTAAPATNWMLGTIASIVGALVTITVTDTGGSGTIASWKVNMSAARGPAGATGATGNNKICEGGTAGGTANAPTVTCSPAFTGARGEAVSFLTGASASTSTVSITADGVTQAARFNGAAFSSTVPLPAGTRVTFVTDGTLLHLIASTAASSGGLSAISTVTAASSTTFDLQNKATVLVPLTHGANITALTVSNVPTACEMIVVRTKDSSSTARTITWGSAFRGSIKLRQAPSVTDVLRWITSDGGTNWYPASNANTLSVSRNNLVAYWIANRRESYSADGLWHNVEPSPVDGSSQIAYDLFLGGASGVETSDPTFSGSIDGGSSLEYFSSDGGDYFSGPAATALNSLHKAGATGTIMLLMDVASLSAYTPLFATFTGSTAQQGIYFLIDNAGKLTFAVGKAAGGTYAFGDKVADAAITTGLHCIGLSWTEGGTGFFYVDNACKQSGTSDTWSVTYTSPSASAASQPLCIGAYGGGSTPMPNGTKVRAVIFKNAALSLAQMQVLEAQLRADCGY